MHNFFIFLLVSTIGFSQNPKQKTLSFIENKQYKKAEEIIIAYVEKNATDIEAIEILGDVYGYQKKWNKAIEQYKILVDKYPNNANYHYKHGGALGMKALTVNKLKALGLIYSIKKSFSKAATLDKNHIEVRWAMVELYMTLPIIVGGSKKKSLKYANELQYISKLDGYLAKGYIYEYDDKPELAEKYYKLAVKISKNISCDEKHTNQRNALYYQLGKLSADYKLQLNKGERCLNTYLKNHSAKDGVPKAWAYYRLAQIYNHRNDKIKALKWINNAIKGLPKIKIFHKFKSTL